MKPIETGVCTRNLFDVLFCVLLLCVSCNVIPGNEFQIEHNPPTPPTPDVSVRTMLLEDYTGIRCPNCPTAAAEAQALKEIYKDRLVVVAIHAGSFAKPYQGCDLNTQAGIEYNTYYSIVSYPQGILCRTPYKGNMLSSYQQWAGALEALPTEAPVSLDLTVSYAEDTRAYELKIGIKRTAEKVASKYTLLVWLVEDHVNTPQTMPNGKWLYDYDQRHVLRGALNSAWGEPIALPALGERSVIKKGSYTLSSDYEQAHCSIVVGVCNAVTKEVIQVVETSFFP